MIPYTDENAKKMLLVASRLLGSCASLDDALTGEFGEDVEVTDFDIELLRLLDANVLECADCGWWCEPFEMNEEQQCESCQ